MKASRAGDLFLESDEASDEMDDASKYIVVGDCEDALTPAGERVLRAWAREHVVVDPDVEVHVDTLMAELPEWAGSVSCESFARAAEIPYDGGAYFRARLNDGLGADCSFFASTYRPSTEYLVDGLVFENSVNLVLGPKESLKTWFVASLLVALAHRRAWLGRELTYFPEWEKRRPVYVDFENGRGELERRLRILGDNGSVKRVAHPSSMLDQDRFWTGLERLEPLAVVIDGLGSGSPGIDEKDSRFANPLRRAAALAEKHKCTFVFLHHPTKADPTSARGTSALEAAADASYTVARPRGSDTARVTVGKWRRDREETKPAPFSFRLTDERGVELVTSAGRRRKAEPEPESEDERVYQAFAGTPEGASTADVVKKVGKRAEAVRAIRDRLVEAGRLQQIGTGPKARFASATPSGYPVPGAENVSAGRGNADGVADAS